jgi:hypothetical protein
MKPKISIITLAVSDLERSTTFYRDGMGLPTYGDFPGITFFELSSTWLALYPQDQLFNHIVTNHKCLGTIW